MELLKDGGHGGSERRPVRDGSGQRGGSEGDDSAEWIGVSFTLGGPFEANVDSCLWMFMLKVVLKLMLTTVTVFLC